MNATIVGLTVLMLSPATDPYPNATILIEADALVRQRKVDANNVAVLDARNDRDYKGGHVPGAIVLPATEWSKAVPDTPAAWAKRLADLGLTTRTPIVVYGGADTRESAHAWWLLKHAGAEDVRLLNGGFPAWENAGGAAETTVNVAKPVALGKLSSNGARLAEKKDVLAIVKDKNAQILDARSEAEYCGSEAKAKRSGHIPGAISLEWIELLDKDKKFKSPDDLKKLFAEKKLDLDKPAVTYCQSGGRAAVLAFGLELMGAKNVRNYYKSWSEWGNAVDTPVAVPKK